MTTEAATLLIIGELAERNGLSVRTIRFYSDSGDLRAGHRCPPSSPPGSG